MYWTSLSLLQCVPQLHFSPQLPGIWPCSLKSPQLQPKKRPTMEVRFHCLLALSKVLQYGNSYPETRRQKGMFTVRVVRPIWFSTHPLRLTSAFNYCILHTFVSLSHRESRTEWKHIFLVATQSFCWLVHLHTKDSV